MPTTLTTGSTDAALRALFSHTEHYAGVEAKGVAMPNGFGMIVGGFTWTGGGLIQTPSKGVHLFTVLDEPDVLGDGSEQWTYEWRTPTPVMTLQVGSLGLGATLLPCDGHISKVIVCGGGDTLNAIGKKAQRIEHNAKIHLVTATNLPDMTTQRGYHGIGLTGFLVFVTGGRNTGGGNTYLSSTESYSVTENKWTAKAPMAFARAHHTQTVLKDGKVLVCGGRNSATGHLASCEVWNPEDNTWKRVGDMAWARADHAAVLLPDGRVLVAGGNGYNASQGGAVAELASAEVFDPASGIWSRLPDMPEPRAYLNMEFIPYVGRIIVCGGNRKTAYWMDVKKQLWKRSVANLETERNKAVSVVIKDRFVMVAGGEKFEGPAFLEGNEEHLYIPNPEEVYMGGLNGIVVVKEVTGSNEFTYETPDYAAFTENVSATVVAVPYSAPERVAPGPYILNRHSSVGLTSIEAVTGEQLNQGEQHTELDLDTTSDPEPAMKFPDEPGWLAFNYGHENQFFPVRYLGRASETALRLDYNFRFPKTIPIGSSVVRVLAPTGWSPAEPDKVGLFYATASAAGRAEVKRILEEELAAGIVIGDNVAYPSDKGLGSEGRPVGFDYKIADKVWVWGGDDIEAIMIREKPEKDIFVGKPTHTCEEEEVIAPSVTSSDCYLLPTPSVPPECPQAPLATSGGDDPIEWSTETGLTLPVPQRWGASTFSNRDGNPQALFVTTSQIFGDSHHFRRYKMDAGTLVELPIALPSEEAAQSRPALTTLPDGRIFMIWDQFVPPGED